MPWTNKKFPESMKKLPVAVRNKAIAIGNALLKGNKKMKEGIIIATAIKNAKAFLAKELKKKSPVKKQIKPKAKKKTKITAKPKVKVIAVKKSKNVPKKKIKKSILKNAKKSVKDTLKNKTTNKVKSKSTNTGKKKITTLKKNVQKAKFSTPVIASEKKSKTKISKKLVDQKKIQAPKISASEDIITQKEIISPVASESTTPEIIVHGEDLNFIPETGDASPLTPVEEHHIENIFHHKEEFAMHQENQKVKEAMSSRKNTARFFRKRGRR